MTKRDKGEFSMKKNHILLLLLSIVCSNAFSNALNLTSANTFIISDYDEVFQKKSLFLSGIAQLKHIAGDYNKSPDNRKDDTSIINPKKKQSVNGMTFILLNASMHRPYLAPYTSLMVEKLEKSRRLINGTEKIYRYLKDVKGYTIVFATNKDRIAFDISSKALGETYTNLASKTFVAHPGNNPEFITKLQAFADLPNTPTSYKNLVHKALTIQPTEHILHAPGAKPDLAYYQYVEQNLGPDKNMIFIDDKKSNIKGFNTLQSTSLSKRIGIQFKNPQQLAQEFVNLGLLSETKDARLLEDIRYPGIYGKIQLMSKKLITKIKRIL